MKYLSLILLLTIGLQPITQAQSVFKNGYIITNQNDTINGLVDYRGEIRNMRVCKFKKDERSDVQTYMPGSIKGYRFTEGKYFISKYIETKSFTDTVFVEFLLKGVSNLYYYNNANYSSYFIESDEGQLLELIDQEEMVEENGVTYIKKNTRYHGNLIYAFKECPEIRRDAEKVKIGHKSLIEITKKYHDYMCDDEQCIVYEKKLPFLRVQLIPMVGYAMSQLETDNSSLEHFNFSPSYSVAGGMGFNFIVPSFNDKLTLYTTTQLTKDYFHGSYIKSTDYYQNYYDAHIHNTRLDLELGIKYTYPKGKFRPFVMAGAFKDWSLKNEATLVTEKVIGSVVSAPSEEKLRGVNMNKLGYSGRIGGHYHFQKIIAFISFDYKHGKGYSDIPSYNGKDTTESITTSQISTGIIL